VVEVAGGEVPGGGVTGCDVTGGGVTGCDVPSGGVTGCDVTGGGDAVVRPGGGGPELDVAGTGEDVVPPAAAGFSAGPREPRNDATSTAAGDGVPPDPPRETGCLGGLRSGIRPMALPQEEQVISPTPHLLQVLHLNSKA
jgi:hypothetical protein